jgi:hypothetical protein
MTLGLFAGKWCSYASGPDLAHDQRHEDGGALVFESEPLPEPFETLGATVCELEISVDKPVAMLAVRLSDVQPDNKATRVSYGLLNLTHRDSSEHPEALERDRRYRVAVRLNEIAHRFPAGHRLRISVSTSYWPLAWPSPVSARVTVYTMGSVVRIPVRAPRDEDDQLEAFGEPRGARPLARQIDEQPEQNWLVHHDLSSDEATLEVINNAGTYTLEDNGLTIGSHAREIYRSNADDVDTVRARTVWERTMRRGEWQIRTKTQTVLRSTPDHFVVWATLDAWEGEKRVFSRNWDEKVPRDLV